MSLTRQQKEKIIGEMKEKLEEQKAMIFFDHSGLKAKDIFLLRKKIKERKGLLKVAKKTLFFLALKNKYPELAEKIKEIEGQLAIIFGFSDPQEIVKELYQFSLQEPNLKIFGGFFEGKFQEPEIVIALAKLPSKKELFLKLTSAISGPIANLIYSLKANLENLVFILSKIKSEKT